MQIHTEMEYMIQGQFREACASTLGKIWGPMTQEGLKTQEDRANRAAQNCKGPKLLEVQCYWHPLGSPTVITALI